MILWGKQALFICCCQVILGQRLSTNMSFHVKLFLVLVITLQINFMSFVVSQDPFQLTKIILESHNIQNEEKCWTRPHVDLLYSLSNPRYIFRESDLDLYVWLVLNLNYMFDTCLFGMLPMGLLTLNYYQT